LGFADRAFVTDAGDLRRPVQARSNDDCAERRAVHKQCMRGHDLRTAIRHLGSVETVDSFIFGSFARVTAASHWTLVSMKLDTLPPRTPQPGPVWSPRERRRPPD